MTAGTGHACTPNDLSRVEVEGSASMLLPYSGSRALGSTASQRAKRNRAEQYVRARERAYAEWRNVVKGKVRKRPREEAQQTLRQQTEAGATPEQASAEGPDVSEAQQTEAGATCEEISAIVAQLDAPRAEHPPESSRIWLWQAAPGEAGGRQLVHRLAVACRAVSPSTRRRWSQSVRSWREPWLQIHSVC